MAGDKVKVNPVLVEKPSCHQAQSVIEDVSLYPSCAVTRSMSKHQFDCEEQHASQDKFTSTKLGGTTDVDKITSINLGGTTDDVCETITCSDKVLTCSENSSSSNDDVDLDGTILQQVYDSDLSLCDQHQVGRCQTDGIGSNDNEYEEYLETSSLVTEQQRDPEIRQLFHRAVDESEVDSNPVVITLKVVY